MRSYYDDEEDFDFADSAAVSRILREQMREQRRFASRHHRGPGDDDDFDDDFDDDDFDDFDASYSYSVGVSD